MKIVYTLKKIIPGLKSIFLAGGTYRTYQLLKDKNLKSWRKLVINFLRDNNFDGTVYIPLYADDKLPLNWTHDKQIKWLSSALLNATVILFWIPRDLKNLPCFTTNFLLGQWFKSGKIVVGSPVDAEKNDYLKWKCLNLANLDWYNNLEELVKQAILKCKD